MVRININEEEVILAKQMRDKLDTVKKYDKIKCANNYIGILGEIVLDRYLKEQSIPHTWVQFLKEDKGWNEPDFIYDGKTIDLKTTRGEEMWFQNPKHDIYIHARIEEGDTTLDVDGLTTRGIMNRMIVDGRADVVKRGSRSDYVVSPMKMIPITFLWR